MEVIVIYILIGFVIFMSVRSIFRTFKGNQAHCDCQNSDCAIFDECSSNRNSGDCTEEKSEGITQIPIKITTGNN